MTINQTINHAKDNLPTPCHLKRRVQIDTGIEHTKNESEPLEDIQHVKNKQRDAHLLLSK